jgi:Dolichyl-phosphate-mannose-protein mannosyltransferase
VIRHVIFILVLAITSNVILAAVLPKIDSWGTETTRIAASVANGQGFSSPFRQATGPSAWIPPVYPYLLAGIFLLFGVFSAISYWMAVGINIIVHAWTCVILYRTAGEVFGTRVGCYSACALASFPLLFYPLVLLHLLGGYGGGGLFISPNVIWYTHLSELAIVLLIWITLHPPHWIVCGIVWGVVALLNPTVLCLVPPFAAWQLATRKGWRYLGSVAFVAALCVAPWLVRNYVVFHRPIFIRDNLGVELRIGNQPGHNGRWSAELHPDRSDYELGRVVEMGEVEYARMCGQEALNTIRSRPGEFFRNVILRVGYWWIGNPMQSRQLGKLRFVKYLPQLMLSLLAFWGAGSALRNRNRNALLFVAVLFFYPLIYYVTHTSDGFLYQYPMHPEMLALAMSAIIREHHPTSGR